MNISTFKTPKNRNRIFYLPESSSPVCNVSSRLSLDSECSIDSTRFHQLSPIKYGSQNYNDIEVIDVLKSMQAEISCLKDRIQKLETLVRNKNV